VDLNAGVLMHLLPEGDLLGVGKFSRGKIERNVAFLLQVLNRHWALNAWMIFPREQDMIYRAERLDVESSNVPDSNASSMFTAWGG